MSTRKQRRWERRARKGIRVMRFRWLKNLMWWLTGVICSFAILAGGIFVGIKVIPLKTYFGEQSKEYVSDEISEKSLLDALMGISSNKLGDIPVVEGLLKSLVNDSGLSNYITVNYDKLKEVRFTYENGETDFMTELQSCITVTATIDSVGGTELLGDFGTLSVFNQVDPVTTAPDTAAEDFNPKLYYYMTADGTYARAYTDDKTLVSEAEGQPLYYPALATVPMVDMVDIVSDRMGTLTVKSLLESFGEVADDNIIVKILGDKKVDEVGSFTAEEILLKDVLNQTSGNQIVFDILCDAVVVEEGVVQPTSDEINLGHIENIDIDKVKLLKIIPNDTENSNKLYKTICSALSTEEVTMTAENVTVGDLKVLNTDNITLVSVLPYEAKSEENPDGTNAMLYDILMQSTNQTDATKIKVSDLNGFSIDDVKLTTVLPPTEDNSDLYDILKDLYDTEDVDTITISKLNSFKVTDVKLETVFSREGHEELYKVIDSAMPDADTSIMTIQEFEDGFKVENIRLFDVLKEPVSTDYQTTAEFESAKKNYDNLKLILEDATGLAASEIKVSNISDGFDVSKIKLSSVLDKDTVTNPILKTLLEPTEVSAEPVTIGTLGSRIDTLTLHDVYGAHCFSESGTGEDKYVRSELPDGREVYTLDEGGTYYRTSDAGIWILLCYEATDLNGDGKTDVYTECTLTVKDLEEGGTDISSRFSGATIYQLIDAGIIDGTNITNANVRKATLQELLDAVNEHGDLVFGG